MKKDSLEEVEFLGWPAKTLLEEVTTNLGGNISFLSCSSINSTSRKIVIEYDHYLKEKKNG